MMDQKRLIYPHRSYKKVNANKYVILKEILVLFFFWLVFTVFVDVFVKGLIQISQEVLDKVYSLEKSSIAHHKLLFWDVYYIVDFGKYPSSEVSLILIFLSFLGMIIFLKFPFIRGVSIFFSFVCFILFVSSLYFFFLPEKFPYSLASFSKIYVDTLLLSWINTGLLAILSVVFFPIKTVLKLSFLIAMYIVLFVIGVVKYVFVIITIKEYSHLFTPLMFFVFGPVIDFLFFLFLYGMFVNKVLNPTRKDIDNWRWVD